MAKTKAELLDDIQAKCIEIVKDTLIEEFEAVRTKASIKTYDINVLENISDDPLKATKRSIGIYVVDEGKPTESAYFRDALPKTANEFAAEKVVVEPPVELPV